MHQTLMAGIGNIYADEILFQARLRPKPAISRWRSATGHPLPPDQGGTENRHRVRRRHQQFLERVTEKDYLLPHRDKGGKCPRCGADVRDAQRWRPDRLLLPALPSGR